MLEHIPHQYHDIALLSVAFIVALPIAFQRSQIEHNAGLRTFPIVSMVSCGFVLIAAVDLKNADAIARVMYGVITGIGFIGGGAIIKYRTNVLGTATAACIWCAGAVGVAVALRQFDIAIFLSLVSTIVLVTCARKSDSDSLSEKDTGEDKE